LLRSEAEWAGRKQAIGILDRILAAAAGGSVPEIGRATTENFLAPCNDHSMGYNHYTETIIARVKEQFRGDFWDSGCWEGCPAAGWGFIFAPNRKAEAQSAIVPRRLITFRKCLIVVITTVHLP